jgi:HEAT repeat protein
MSTGENAAQPKNPVQPKPTRRLTSSVRSLMMLIACCAVGFWAWRYASENSDPFTVDGRNAQKRALAGLRATDPAAQVSAIQELERLSFEAYAKSIAELMITLQSPSTEVRAASVRALGTIAGSAMREGTDEAAVQSTATALLRLLKDPEPDLRSAAAASIGTLVSPGGRRGTQVISIDRESLLAALGNLVTDPDPGVRRSAIRAIIASQDPMKPTMALIQALKDELPENRAAALAGLPGIQQNLDPWLEPVLRMLEHDPDPAVRDQAATVMARLVAPAITGANVESLKVRLSSSDARTRSLAIASLGSLGPAAIPLIPDLIRVLNEPLDPTVTAVRDPSLRLDPASESAISLGRIAPRTPSAPVAIAALSEVVVSGPPSRRGWAAVALGDFGRSAEPAIPQLVALIQQAPPDDPFQHEASAVQALGKIGPNTASADSVIDAITAVFQSKLENSRIQAAEALARFGPAAAKALPEVQALAKDSSPRVRETAERTILALENPPEP